MAKLNSILILKVTLQEIEPPIWRRLEVPSRVTLARLHLLLQTAMGWTDSHLHEFVVGQDRYGPSDSEMEENQRDEATSTVGDLMRSAGDSLTYKYDFGDGWEHEVVLEKISAPEPGAMYPACVGGERACPPEDSGGAPGYSDLLEAISDPNHPEHVDRLEWVGATFDPEAFSVENVNRLLQSTPRRPRS